MVAFRVDEKNGTFYIRGMIDEHADFRAVSAAATMLCLNFRDVVGFSSSGIQRFIAFTATWSDRPVEFHECSMIVVDALLTVPSLVGPPARQARIVSLEAPFTCKACDHDAYVMLGIEELSFDGNTITGPTKPCPRCGTAMAPTEHIESYAALFDTGSVPK